MKKNQGFSLVELIVVIAIMAVLVGVLAPAYLKYVEKSRKSSDISSISDMLNAAEKVAVDVQFEVPAGTQFQLVIASGVCTPTVADNALQTEWQSIAGASYTCKSSEFKGESTTIIGTVNNDGALTWSKTANSTIITYSKDFQKKYGL